MQIFNVEGIKMTTIVVVRDETGRGSVGVYFHLLFIIDRGEQTESADKVFIKRLCSSSQLRSKRALGRIVRH